MKPDSQLLMAEIKKMFTEHSLSVNKQLADQKDLLEQRFLDADTALEKRFEDVDAVVEQRIIDSELRQGLCLSQIEATAGQFESWRQDTDGAINDLRIEVGKLAKH